MNRDDRERIVALEVHMSDQDNKLLEIMTDIKEIKAVLLKQDGMELRLKRLEESSNLWRWLSPSLAAALGAVLTYLVNFYLSNGGKP